MNLSSSVLISNLFINIPQVRKKSLTVTPFGILSYSSQYSKFIKQLVELYEAGKIKPYTDFGERAPNGPFSNGIRDVAKGVNWLHSGKSMGKVMVQVTRV